MKGKLEDVHITKVMFKEGNEIFVRGNFGCGILVKEQGISPFFEIKTPNSSSFSDSEELSEEDVEP
jgi:hypothetical protein